MIAQLVHSDVIYYCLFKVTLKGRLQQLTAVGFYSFIVCNVFTFNPANDRWGKKSNLRPSLKASCVFSAAIGRTLIPRYFRSIFEGGATELYYVLKHPKESFHNNFVSLDCDQCTMVTQNGKPMFTQVCSHMHVKWTKTILLLLSSF